MTKRVRTETRGRVFLIGLDRADKLNAFDVQMLRELAEAVTRYEDDPELFCAVLHANGKSFTAGLDLAEVGAAVRNGESLFPAALVDPLGLHGRTRSKPLVAAAQGHCLTIGIELLLACDIRVASEDTRFGQIEIERGIFPFGGATIRLPQVAGWGNAMRWLLTAERFDAHEALRIGLVQEVTPAGAELDRAIAIAETIASCAPLGVQATLRSARRALEAGPLEAARELEGEARKIMATEDAAEGVRSFVERRKGTFRGK